jgi:hypothetical protein
MDAAQKPQFLKMLTAALAAYGKPLPETGILTAWWENLQAYPIQIVAAAFRAYCDEVGEFAPVPAGIAMRCKLMDGRPGAEEAWAIALASQDEADTVVWTAECAEAFYICRTVFPNEVGARMAFKEAYERLVAAARAERRPAEWSASLGWDVTKRTAVLTKAVSAGLLPAPSVVALLPAPVGESAPDANARKQIAAIRKMLADSTAEKEAAYLAEVEQARIADEDFKRRTNEQVAEYLAKGAE